MKKVLLAVTAAVLGSAIIAGGNALADDDRHRYRPGILATGLTLCPMDNRAVFPATNVSRRPVRVWVSCVDSDGVQFDDSPVMTWLGGGQAVTLEKACNDTSGLVRCTIASRQWSLKRMRGVLHIIGDTGFVVTEATDVGSGDDD